MIQTLREVIESRDREVREMEINFTALGKEHKECPNKIHNLELDMKRNKERFTKLYTLAQELEQELKDTRDQLEERDTWFKENVDVIRNMQRAIDSRDNMVQPLKKGLPSTSDLGTTTGSLLPLTYFISLFHHFIFLFSSFYTPITL